MVPRLAPIAVPLAVALAACALVAPQSPPPVPPVDAAAEHLDLVIEAALARDLDRLCGLATGTCEAELQGVEHLAPNDRPTVIQTDVYEPHRIGDAWATGGVLFTLCGLDGHGNPYESEVLVIEDFDHRLLATAAVFWVGTGIAGLDGASGLVVVDEPSPDEGRCP